jgi:hypothetical protein
LQTGNEKTAEHIRNYAQDKTDKLLELDGIRAVLLRTSKQCVFGETFDQTAMESVFSRLVKGVEREYGVATQLLYDKPESVDVPKIALVAVWQNSEAQLDSFFSAVNAVKDLTDYLGLSRYKDSFSTVLTSEKEVIKSMGVELETSVSAGITYGVAAIKQKLSAIMGFKKTNSGNTSQSYAITGNEPSVLILHNIQERLGLPTPDDLLDSVSKINCANMRIKKDYSQYRRMAVAELAMNKMAKNMLEAILDQHNTGSSEEFVKQPWAVSDLSKLPRFSRRQLEAIDVLKDYLHAGYTQDSLELINTYFKPEIPPSDIDILYHVVLYSAMLGGARKMVDIDIQTRIANKYKTVKLDYTLFDDKLTRIVTDGTDLEYLKEYPGFVGTTEDNTVVIRPCALVDGTNPHDAIGYFEKKDISKTPLYSKVAVLSPLASNEDKLEAQALLDSFRKPVLPVSKSRNTVTL